MKVKKLRLTSDDDVDCTLYKVKSYIEKKDRQSKAKKEILKKIFDYHGMTSYKEQILGDENHMNS